MAKFVRCKVCDQDTIIYDGEWRIIMGYRNAHEYFSCNECTKSLIYQDIDNEQGADEKVFWYWRRDEYDNSEFMTEEVLKKHLDRIQWVDSDGYVKQFIDKADLYDEQKMITEWADVTLIRAN